MIMRSEKNLPKNWNFLKFSCKEENPSEKNCKIIFLQKVLKIHHSEMVLQKKVSKKSVKNWKMIFLKNWQKKHALRNVEKKFFFGTNHSKKDPIWPRAIVFYALPLKKYWN